MEFFHRSIERRDTLEFDFSKLLGRMKERREGQREMAAATGMDKSTFNQKINNHSEFTQSEIIRICDPILRFLFISFG